MGISQDFPRDPYVVLDPEIRWYPGDEVDAVQRASLIPPLVAKIRAGVKEWREASYAGASETTRALLRHWFETERLMRADDGAMKPFRYYFAQREAVESAVWLYEVQGARDPYALIKYDSHGAVSKGMFQEDWTRYVMKLATGAGKTKVMSLLIAWAFYHRTYEADSDLSTNFLVLAPNIIVLDRLRVDFDGLKIFFADGVLPDNGYEGRNWRDDFQITLHVQDEISAVSETGNIFLSNMHRLFLNERQPSFKDPDTTEYFLGKRPTGKTNESRTDLGKIIREVRDLVVINDEAHHIHDAELAWFKNIEDISNRLRLKGSKLSAQFDLTATPKHTEGAIFVQTISDYPLVEAIRQGVVKTPVLPDEASRAKLQERNSDKFVEQYADYLRLGVLEWKQTYDQLKPMNKKSVLFVMTDDTKHCDDVGTWLEDHSPELRGAVLVIHTKNNGEVSEASGKSAKELDELRKASRNIDSWESPYKAIVSVMVLREGWDVQNVVSIVGLRPFKSKSQILPEQTLGRGLRCMFRGEGVQEKVSVVGTDAFIEFVESIKSEGVELEYKPMGAGTRSAAPLVVEVDRENPKKDIDALDIELPVLSSRIHREYKSLNQIDVASLPSPRLSLKEFTSEQQREIVFKDIDTEQRSHTTVLDTDSVASPQAVVGYYVRTIMRDLRLVGGADVLFGKVKEYIGARLFAETVELDDPGVLRNLSETGAQAAILDGFKGAINALTVQDRGTTEVRDSIKLSKVRPHLVNEQPYVPATKSVFNKIVADNRFELEFAGFLEASEIVSFAKNSQSVGFRMEYQTADGGIANYYPDFIVKQASGDIWLIETKGREDIEDPRKWERLQQWCTDATALANGEAYHALFVRQERWDELKPRTFADLVVGFGSPRDHDTERA